MIRESIQASIETKQAILDQFVEAITKTGTTILDAFKSGRKVLIAGNGGSAAQAQHLSAELVVRYEKERKHLPALALNTDTSILTACSNDYTYDDIFAKQIQALGQPGDVFVALSTSGNSPNILKAMQEARDQGMAVIGLSGKDGGKMVGNCDDLIVVPSPSTARIQEAHLLIIHLWCQMIDHEYTT